MATRNRVWRNSRSAPRSTSTLDARLSPIRRSKSAIPIAPPQLVVEREDLGEQSGPQPERRRRAAGFGRLRGTAQEHFPLERRQHRRRAPQTGVQPDVELVARQQLWSEIDREARKGSPTPSDHAPVVVDLDKPGLPFDPGWEAALERIAARSKKKS